MVTNIPITIGKGLTGIAWGEEITEDQKQFTKKLFENTSKTYEFPEDYLDIFLALTSSGPAIIGFGNIASAIVTPLLDNKLIQPEHVVCVVNSEKSLEKIKKKL